MIRFVVLISLIIPNWAMSNDVQVSVLLNICEIAQKNTDRGTISNVANQLKNKVRPDEPIKAKQFDACLQAAFGEIERILDLNGLLELIRERAKQLEDDCLVLLKIAPELAISHPTCKPLLID